MVSNRVLAIAAGSGRMGYVLLASQRLKDWGIAFKASSRPELAAEQTQKWISYLRPDVVVTEKLNRSRKSAKSQSIINAIANVAAHNYLLDVSLDRPRAYKNKYLEAQAIADRFPDLLPWLPCQPKIWQGEPKNTVFFEAMALALALEK